MAMILNGERLERRPPGQSGAKSKQRVYYLRAPNLYDKAKVRRACIAQGVAHHPAEAMLDLAREGVAAIEPDEQSEGRRNAEAAITAYEQMLGLAADAVIEDGEPGGELAPSARQAAIDLEDLLRAHYRPFAAALGDNDYFQSVFRTESLRLLLDGWENLPGNPTFRSGDQGAPDEVLMVIDDGDREWLEFQATALFAPTPAESKNSGSPGSTPPDPATSTAAKGSRPTTQARANGTSQASA